MWTAYRRCDNRGKEEYPKFVFIEHDKDTDAAEIFKMYFDHRPFEYGKPDWNYETNAQLMYLLGSAAACSCDYSDCEDSFVLLYTYFIKTDEGYRKDMELLNAFLKRDDVLFLSDREISK